MAAQNRIMMIYSILGRGKSKRYMDMLNEKSIRFHIQTVAFGTAPSEMMDIFGLGNNDKDAVLSFAPEDAVRGLTGELGKNIGSGNEYGGMMMTLRLSAVSRLSAEIITRASASNKETGEKTMADENKYQQQLILITVDRGCTDQVMQTAKRAGATGGTILRARLADTEKLEQLGMPEAQEEKEIITILSPASTAAEIMNEVNRLHGMNSDAHGMVVALPVDKALNI